MNTLLESWNWQRLKTVLPAANNSKLRYPLLVLTVLLLGVVMIAARQLTAGILADMQAVCDVLNISP